MARAKRTDRADARRRYRLTHDDADAPMSEDEGSTPNVLSGSDRSVGASRSSRGGAAARATTQPRPMGLIDSMRAAYHRPQIREDIAALPSLLRTRAFVIPLALVVGGVGAVAALPGNSIAGLLFPFIVVPPPMIPIFIAGFFAKRASYLLGFLIGVASVIGFTFLLYVVPSSLSADSTVIADQRKLLYSLLLIGPGSGIIYAAGAAWYRRFLSFSSAQRNRARVTSNTKPKRATGR
ncbi:MAG: hypothetical protein ABI573_11640 [Chloroflexota bacterium]